VRKHYQDAVEDEELTDDVAQDEIWVLYDRSWTSLYFQETECLWDDDDGTTRATGRPPYRQPQSGKLWEIINSNVS